MRIRLALVALLVVVAGLQTTPASAGVVPPTVEINGGKLTVTGTENIDFVEIGCDGGDVSVTYANVDPTPCSSIDQIVVKAQGGGDWIDLQGVLSEDFTSLSSIDANGGSGLDAYTGSPLDDVFNGAGETDRFYVSGGTDTFVGDAGLDEIHLTTVGDVTLGLSALESEFGTVSFSSVTKVVITSEGSGVRWDARGFTGITYLTSGAGADVLLGGRGRDWMLGGAGNDRLVGNANNDLLFGEGGSDTIRGGAGSDRLSGGPKRDDCSGGPGQDYVSADCE
ncbi:MAG TPA: calcium-binding protein [Actinomycetota bacterium]|nr:calcium-binding protein [Actinomycetota bacterium]